MAPAFVLLDTNVRLVSRTGEKAVNDGEREEEDYHDGLVRWVREGKIRLVTDSIVDPPEISTVSIQLPASPREIDSQVEGLTVTSADQSLIVISTGPKSPSFGWSGHYLIHDAAAAAGSALFLATPVERNGLSETFGRAPVVMRRGQGSSSDIIVLAMVLWSWRTERHALLRWSPSTSSTGEEAEPQQWARRDARLPEEVAGYAFHTDVAFAFGGRWACWADLHLGILACDVLSPDPEFHLVPLPEEYARSDFPMARGRPNVHCTVGCVGGEIKLLYMDGYDDEHYPRDQVTISSWTLLRPAPSPSMWRWARDDGRTLRVGDLWADDSFLAIPGLPRRPPMCPVLSPGEPDVVYFFTSDLAWVDGHIGTKGEYVIALNMQSKKIQSWTKCPPGRSRKLIPFLIGAGFCAGLNSSNPDGQVSCS